MGAFAAWQPAYAEVGVACFPVAITERDKTPMTRGYMSVGLRGSRALADKFADAEAFGISLRRSKITVLDVDTPDERALADAMSRHGHSPFVVRSGSGHWQAWYRHNGETREIRPDPAWPIDILGVVAPPSQGWKGAYRIIAGDLSDLKRLPVMLGRGGQNRPPITEHPAPSPGGDLAAIQPGQRSDALWRFLMSEAVHVDDLDALIDVARSAASAFASPLTDAEVIKAARSAWSYESRGENWIARGKQRPPPSEPDGLIWAAPDAFVLWKVLQHYNGGRARFFVANALHESMPGGGWSRKRLAAARRVLLDLGYLRQVRRATSEHGAAIFAWGAASTDADAT